MESILISYQVLLYPRAYRDIDGIYSYIVNEIQEPEIAKRQIERIWDSINSLTLFPYSHQDRLTGRYAKDGYKQLLVDNYIAIYKIDEEDKKVYIVTIQYSKRNI